MQTSHHNHEDNQLHSPKRSLGKMCDKIITKHKPDPWLSRTGDTWDGESNAIHVLGEGDKLEHRIQERPPSTCAAAECLRHKRNRQPKLDSACE